ncbi:polyketide cyclase/dehydrase/lipid transport protein [Streptomyces sp. BK022]|uniref:SRPBCC family protein n=1 Tax=Streptomyces sp. BK022 TaxID=2512123 RepID=UPI001028B818|nr:SRPBCC family protein [Streptomyces sp. BK022]RZU45643.1 polyketide cyclase/dehydrase/lipid transport protein [Streptomyces sp. BK022]
MARTSHHIDVPHTPEHVWRLIGGFGSLPDWLPYIPGSTLGEGGRVRTLTNADGDTIVERLTAFDEAARTYTYTILQAPFPVTDYLSTLTVHPLPEAGTARVEWSGTFTPADATDEEAVALFHGIYTEGLAALERTLRGA